MEGVTLGEYKSSPGGFPSRDARGCLNTVLLKSGRGYVSPMNL